MIGASELRIGNWVNWEIYKGQSFGPEILKDLIIEPIRVDCNILIALNDGAKHYFPIELAPDILEKVGFEQSNEFDDTFRFKEIDVYYRKSYCEWTVDDRGDNEGTKPRFIKYLHQLQSIYHSLTGEELKIEL